MNRQGYRLQVAGVRADSHPSNLTPQTSSRGFTLVELMVVIAIIGLLTSVVLASLSDARARGRDSARITEIQQLQKALELYFADHGNYPLACGLANQWRGHGSNFGNCDANYITGLAPTYIPQLPIDPLGDNTDGFLYRVDASGQNYKIMSYQKIETKTYTAGEPNARCASSCIQPYCSGASAARHTPDASCW